MNPSVNHVDPEGGSERAAELQLSPAAKEAFEAGARELHEVAQKADDPKPL